MQGPIFLGRACRIDKTINRYGLGCTIGWDEDV